MTDRDPYQELVDEARHRDAVDDRARTRWLRTQLVEGARLAGTLADLAEQAVVVTLRTESGTIHRGRLEGVAGDHVVVRASEGSRCLVTLDALTDVRPQPGGRPAAAAGVRDRRIDRTLAEVLARAAADRPRVHLRVRGHAEGLAGRLEGVGEDVATVLVGQGGDVVYVRIAAITEATIDP